MGALLHDEALGRAEEGDHLLDFGAVRYLLFDLQDGVVEADLTIEDQAVSYREMALCALVDTCLGAGFSLGYEPRFGWAWGRGACPSPSRVPIYIGALLRYNRVSSPVKVYSPLQISSARRFRRGCYEPI